MTSRLDISFDGFWLCRLATDPDPSDEQRGVSGFTYSVSGESLLEPSIWCQPQDVENLYGRKEENDPYFDGFASNDQFHIRNIREASPDYSVYNGAGIGIKVTGAHIMGIPLEKLSDPIAQLGERLNGCLVRFENRPEDESWPWEGPIFEGRNQIVSDGDPDRFTVSPFVITLATPQDDKRVLKRFDPLDPAYPEKELIDIFPNDVIVPRLPVQRFAMSEELLDQIGVTDLNNHFVNRANWLKSKISEAEAMGKMALAEAYKSRLFGVEFFTQSTGPTVFANRLLSRIPLRQLYRHSIRGNAQTQPVPFVDPSFFSPFTVDTNQDWEILYYLGGYDGDLMTGWCTGTLTLPTLDS